MGCEVSERERDVSRRTAKFLAEKLEELPLTQVGMTAQGAGTSKNIIGSILDLISLRHPVANQREMSNRQFGVLVWN